MVPDSYHNFFTGCTTVAGALIGLLFVAISVAPHKLAGEKASAEFRMGAGLAFSTLTNTLVMSLIALMPGESLGVAGIVASTLGITTMVRVIQLNSRERAEPERPGSLPILIALACLYCLQLATAVRVLSAPHNPSPIHDQSLLAIAFFLVAIYRAWELVGGQHLSLLSWRPKESPLRRESEEPIPTVCAAQLTMNIETR